MSKILDQFELGISWAVWPGAVIYSLYRYWLLIPGITNYLHKGDLTPGWIANKSKDVSDIEWNSFRSLIIQYYHIFFIHIIISQICQIFRPKLLPFVLLASGVFAVNVILSFQAFLILMLQISIVLVLHLKLNRLFSYLFFLIVLFLVCHPIMGDIKSELFAQDSFRAFLFDVSVVWMAARCLSFTVDRLDCNQTKEYVRRNELQDFDLVFTSAVPPFSNFEFVRVFAYMFYLPVFFFGPITQYDSFCHDLQREHRWSIVQVFVYLSWAAKHLFWALVLELALHHFYSSALQFYPSLIRHFDGWALAGFGYSLTILFFLKYFVVFGCAEVVARFDRIATPEPPKCTSRIHSPTHLWRTFDRGLYLWLTKYFYKPIIGNNWSLVNKACASFICFTNVCLWHRMEDAVIVWCAINFLMILIELGALHYSKKPKYSDTLALLSPSVRPRLLRLLLLAPFFACTIISNIYFLSNIEIGHYFFRRLMFTFPTPFVPLMIVMYCGCLVSQHQLAKEQAAVISTSSSSPSSSSSFSTHQSAKSKIS